MFCADAIRGKVVLDVGTGTGILAMLAAKKGAAKVFAVEASQIAHLAKILVHQNNLADRVAVVQGKMEDVDLGEKVDVIISEWMGFYLLHEAMLNSVLYARDKWLKPGGLLLPSTGTIYLAPVTIPELEFQSSNAKDPIDWSNFCGLDFRPFEQLLLTTIKPPLVRVTSSQELRAAAQVVAHFGKKCPRV